MTVGVTVTCGWWPERTASVVRNLARASPDVMVIRSPFAPDPDLLAQARDGIEVIEAETDLCYRSPGCVCCAVRLDLVDVLAAANRRRRPPTHVIVEALPHDDPACIVQTVLAEHQIQRKVTLDAVVTVVDGPAFVPAVAAMTAGERPPDQAWPPPLRDALRLADRIVLTQTCYLSWRGANVAAWAALEANPRAGLDDLDGDGIDPAAVLGARAWALDRVPQRVRHPGRPGLLSIDLPGSLDHDRTEDWLERLHASHATRLLRFEAVLAIAGRNRRQLASGVRTTVHTSDGHPWRPDEPRTSSVRLVGDGLDHRELAAGLAACAVWVPMPSVNSTHRGHTFRTGHVAPRSRT